MNSEQQMTYEEAYTRLEEILENMNGGKLSLEQSLSLFEEADKLIQFCNQKLTLAEQKIEMLVKNREAEATLSPSGTPVTEPFLASSLAALKRDLGT